MWVYYLLFGGLLATAMLDLTSANQRLKNCAFWFWIIVFCLFRGLRWDTGTDFPQFYTVFEESKFSNIFNFWRYGYGSERMEFGYVFLNAAINSVFHHFTFFNILTDAFTLWSFSLIIKRFCPRYSLLALAMMMITIEPFPVRQTIATALLCHSYLAICDKNLKRYIVFVALATTIHSSSIIMFPLYWVTNMIHLGYKHVAAYIALVLGRGLMQIYFVDLFSMAALSFISGGLTENYFATTDTMEIFNVMTVTNSVVTLCLLIFTANRLQKNTEDSSNLNIAANMYFFSVCFAVIASIPGLDIISRLVNNFLIFYPICIVCIFRWARRYGILVSLFIFMGFYYIKWVRNPVMDKEGIYYKECYYPYYSVFDSKNEKMIRHAPWPYHND